MNKKFLVTTPIYYPNGYPHIGHAYSSFIADVYARYKRLLGYEVKFSTGNDENSQKILQKAQEEGKEVMFYLNEMEQKWRGVWDALAITYTDFIRTTDPQHVDFVQKVLDISYQKGDIYQGEYKGYYCVGCEGFKTEKDLIKNEKGEFICPDHLTPPNLLVEKNRFFRLKNYQKALEDFFEKNPEFVAPDYRYNESKAFVRGGLEDFSVSRETNTFGIPLPFDPKQVTYVWYDALFNYVTVCQKDGFWTENTEKIHILGKDISRFHAIFWPAMLMSAGYPLPNREYTTGWFTVNGQKMSKSLGNVIDPVEVVQNYDRDAVVFTLLYDVPIGSDGDFSLERLHNVYESMIIGGWGNLVNRVVSLCAKYGITEGKYNESIGALIDVNITTLESKYLNNGNLQTYLQHWYQGVQAANEFITRAEPWKKYKNETTKQEALDDLAHLLVVIKNLALLSAPFLINSFQKIQKMLGNEILASVDSSQNLMNDSFQNAFEMKSFSVNLQPEIIYQKKE